MPLPQFNSEYEGDQTLPVEAMPPTKGQGIVAGVREGLAGSLMASGITRVKGALGDQTFVPFKDASQEMQLNGYDPSVLPKGGLSRGFLDALKDQQSALKRNAEIADDAGVRHTEGWMPSTRGMSEFAGGSAADSPFFMLGGGAMGLGLRAAGVAAEGGIAGLGIRAGEGATLAGSYDVARKAAGTAPGDKDLGMYDFARDMALGGVLGTIGGPRGKLPTEADAQGFIKSRFPDAQITSGFRTVKHNAEIGGAKNSLHTRGGGQAVDVVLPQGVTPDQFRGELEKQGLPITEFLVEKKGDPHSTGDHVHWGWGPKHGADPHALAAATADAMNDRVPAGPAARPLPSAPDMASADASTKPVWQTPEADAQLAKMSEQPKQPTPELEKLNQQANDAVADAKHATLMASGEPGFTTSKGSQYIVHDDGTTTRNKSFHPEHVAIEGADHAGPQPRSEATFYVTPEQADELGLFQTQGEQKSIEKMPDGRIGVKYLSGKDKGKFEKRTVMSPQAKPAVGLMPIETFRGGKSVHFGNKITELTHEADTEDFDTHMSQATDSAKAQAELEQATVAALKCAVVKGFG